METAAKYDSTTSLADRLRDQIKRAGPITFYDWMRAALYDEVDGYYRKAGSQPWGRGGDYRTSPERSSLFASTFARYFAKLYEELGLPTRWTIVEAGAGNGEFAAGILQALQTYFPQVFAATSYLVDEKNPHAGSMVHERLASFGKKVEFRKLVDCELDPGIVFSNELLDAFPVHRVTLRNNQLLEYYVTADPDGDFKWVAGDPSTNRLALFLEQGGIKLEEGQVTEICLEIEDWLRTATGVLKSGYLITVDYGANADELYSPLLRYDGTLRSFFKHRIMDNILAQPGEQDLTSTIDWSFVERTGSSLGLEVREFARQDRFMLAAGLLEQLEIEGQRVGNDAERLRLSTAAREMILPDGMAAYFQVMVQKKVEVREPGQ